jgi:hypothetical protein
VPFIPPHQKYRCMKIGTGVSSVSSFTPESLVEFPAEFPDPHTKSEDYKLASMTWEVWSLRPGETGVSSVHGPETLVKSPAKIPDPHTVCEAHWPALRIGRSEDLSRVPGLGRPESPD